MEGLKGKYGKRTYVKSLLSEQFGRIYAFVYQSLDLSHYSIAVGSVSHTKPLAGRVEHLHGSCSIVNQFVHHQRDKELGFEVLHVLRVAEELLEELLAILEIVGCEAPHVHGNGNVFSANGHPLALLVLVADFTVDTHDFRALNHVRQVTLVVLAAHATSHGTVLRQCIADAETYHGIVVLRTFGQLAQELADGHKGVTVVEIIAVDHTEGLTDSILTHQHSVVCSPRFHTAFGTLEAFGQIIQCLENQFTRDMSFVLADDFVAEILFKILADHKDQFAETGLNGVIDRIVHNRFAVRAQAVQLLQTAITASHACGQKK